MYILTLLACGACVLGIMTGMQSNWPGWGIALLVLGAIVCFFAPVGDEYD
jgi:hypothetical protein